MDRPRLVRLHVAVLLASLFLIISANASTVPERKEVLARAKQSYYSLRRLGLLEFTSSIKPTWEVTLAKELRDNPSGAQEGIKMLNGLHFVMNLDAKGNVKVDHSTNAPPPTEQAAKAFDQIYSGMDQAVSGFFATWSVFMLTSPLPEVDGQYGLEDLGAEYRLSYKEGTADVVTSMNKDLVITEVKVASPEFVSVVRPQFSKVGGKLVLTGYKGDYHPATGPGTVTLDVKLDYQEVQGLEMPNRLNLDSTYDGAANQMQLVFSNYKVTMR
jgi:hypothetical protein